jgi:hypothetical protein
MASTITAVTPASAVPGQTVKLTGTGLDSTNVDFFTIGPNQAVIAATPPRSATQVTLIVPSGTPVNASTPIGLFKNGAAVTGTGIPATVAITAAPAQETIVTSLAKVWALEVTPDAGTTWVRCHGITDFKPDVSDTMQDDSDYDGGVWGSDVRTQLKWSLTGKFKRGPGAVTGTYDAGQEILYAAHDQVGPSGVVQVRWFERIANVGKAYSGFAYVGWSPDGGDTTALESVSFTLSGVGARTPITNPYNGS